MKFENEGRVKGDACMVHGERKEVYPLPLFHAKPTQPRLKRNY